jgi:hypothetical protein
MADGGPSVAALDTEPPGLPVLLSQALVAFTIEADNEAEHLLPHVTSDHGATLPHYPMVLHRGGYPDGS